MIRFIATDLDGTLLDGKRRLPAEIFPLISALSARGILFAPASGRQYANLKKLFAPVKEDVLFLCENGALVKYRGETLHLHPIEDGILKETLDCIRAVKGLHPLLCGTETAYIEEDAEPFFTVSFAAYTNCMRVDSLDNVIGREPICKIAVYDDEPAAEHCMRELAGKFKGLCTTVSGMEWCDVMAEGANKGEAVRKVMERFGFKREECIAFGDHMNDYEMLSSCGRAFVTENAYPPLKKIIGETIPANTEGGDILKLKEIAEEI